MTRLSRALLGVIVTLAVAERDSDVVQAATRADRRRPRGLAGHVVKSFTVAAGSTINRAMSILILTRFAILVMLSPHPD